MRRLTALLIGLTVTLGLSGCPAAPPPAPTPAPTSTVSGDPQPAGVVESTETAGTTDDAAGFESPEAAFAAAQQSVRDEDWRGLANCMTSEAQQLFAGLMVFAAAFGGDESAPLLAVMAEHGVEMPSLDFSITANEDPESTEPEDEPEIEDLPGFLGDMIAAMAAAELDPGDGGGPTEWANAELSGLEIDGDEATGTLVIASADGEVNEPISFARTENGWLIGVSLSVTSDGGAGFSSDPAEPLAESELEEGLSSSIALTSEMPFEQQFFGTEFPDGTLYVTLNLVGAVILDTYEYGEFQVVSAEDDTGAALELAAPVKNNFNEEFGEAFVELNDFFLDKKNTLPILFALTPPADGAEQLASLELSIRLKVRESTVVEDVLASLGEAIDVEGVGEFTVNKQNADNGNPDHGLEIEFKGDEDAVESITLLDVDGAPLDTAGTFSFGFGSSKTFGISTDGELPEGTQMRIALGGSESIKVVPLTFEDLDLD